MSNRTKLGKVAYTPRGEYAADKTYQPLDVVSYEGSSYVALAETTGVLPTDETYFALVAARGDAGGAKGDKGDPGQAASVTVGSVYTVEPFENARVINVGTENAAVLDFYIPRGEPGSSCLIEGTNIRMADGSEQPIETLRAGDVVQSYDPALKTPVPAVVIAAYVTGYTRSFTAYNFSNGSHLTVFGLHGFYNEASGMTKDIRAITEKDGVRTLSGKEARFCGKREIYLCGEKKARWNLLTSNNLYFANDILLGSRPYNKLHYLLDRGRTIPKDIAAVWRQDAEDYNAYTAFLNDPAFYAEVSEPYREWAETRDAIRENRQKLADSDYKVQKFMEGVLDAAEWIRAKAERAGFRKAINDREALLAESRARVDAVIRKYRDPEQTPRGIFEACCSRDNAIYDRVLEYFSSLKGDNGNGNH